MLKFFGCQMHCGVGEKGLTHSIDYLKDHYPNFDLTVIPEILKEEQDIPGLKRLNSVIATCSSIADYSYNHILKEGNIPVFIGGDHAAAMGTVSASSTYYGETGLIWIDAHPDINTDATSASGNIHGMPVAALIGEGYDALTKILTENKKIKKENVVLFGLRDIDPPEQITLDRLNIKYFTYRDIQEKGLDVCLDESIKYLSHLEHIHVSFDIDSVNPQILPGVSVPVESGFTLPEIYTVFDRYLNELPVGAIDVMEFNSVYDKDKKTSDFVINILNFIQKHYEK